MIKFHKHILIILLLQEWVLKKLYLIFKDFPLLYGLISLIIAILIGWSGAEIFKRLEELDD